MTVLFFFFQIAPLQLPGHGNAVSAIKFSSREPTKRFSKYFARSMMNNSTFRFTQIITIRSYMPQTGAANFAENLQNWPFTIEKILFMCFKLHFSKDPN